jgi:hypothetical protein
MTTRRTAIKLVAGAGVGAFFTPAPWKLIRDTALWSQDWPGVPHPLRGAITEKTGVCSLCPAACAVKARCDGDQPISMAGMGGGLCPIGVTAHQLPYWPDRVKKGPVEEARAAIAKAGPGGVAVLDLRPGRAASAAYRKMDAVYLAPRVPSVAVNVAAAKTIVSVGAPLLDGFVAPAEVWKARDRFRLVQIERELSRTATLADEWLAEGDPAEVARRSEGPVLVIDREMSERAVALSSKETVTTLPASGGADLRGVADGSIRVLYIDESHPDAYIPWQEIEPKLTPGAVVVAFVWSKEGYARHAQFMLPTAVFPEATGLMKAPEWVVDPVEFVTGAKVEETAQALPEGFHRVNPAAAWFGPVSSKLSRESNLTLGLRQVAVNPADGIADQAAAFLMTGRGKVAVKVVHDASVPAGSPRYLPTPDVLDLGESPKVVAA